MSSSSDVSDASGRGAISRVVLGTAALGLAYGLPREGGNARRLPEGEAKDIIERAWEAGVRVFDTAPAYGDAESLLGDALGERGIVWTKTNPCDGPAEDVLERARDTLRRSRERLRRQRVDLLQWHNWTREIGDSSVFRETWSALAADPGVTALGASTYGATNARAAIESGAFRVVQVEFSLLNQSVVNEVSAAAAAHGVQIAVRSVFLQGALTEEGRELPRLPRLHEGVARARECAARFGIRLEHLALKAALSHPAVSFVLVGVDRAAQLDEIASAASSLLDDDQRLACAALDLGPDPATDPLVWLAMQRGQD